MLTWRRGTRILFEKTRRLEVPLLDLVGEPREASAAPRAGHGGLPHRRPDEHADGAPPQPEALQGAARAQRHPDDHDRRIRRASSRTSASPWTGRSQVLRADDGALRLHGKPEPAEGARDRPQARLDLRHHVDVVLPVAAVGPRVGAVGHAALAGPASSSCLPATPTTPRTISRSRPTGWSRSARRSRSRTVHPKSGVDKRGPSRRAC